MDADSDAQADAAIPRDADVQEAGTVSDASRDVGTARDAAAEGGGGVVGVDAASGGSGGGGSGSSGSGGGGSGGGSESGGSEAIIVASALKFETQPLATHTGFVLAPIVVRVCDSQGNTVNTTVSIKLEIASGSALDALAGETQVTAVQGVATFSRINLTQSGTYTLHAAVPWLASDLSEPFVIDDTTALGGSGHFFIVTESNSLMTFDAETPERPFTTRTLGPLDATEHVIGLDFRPANGLLYALTLSGSTARLYTLDPAEAVLTGIGGGFTLPGTRAALDFDPGLDRIRVVTDTGENLLVNPESGDALPADASVTYASTDIHSGESVAVADAAFSDNLPGASHARLFAIDHQTDSLIRIAEGANPGMGIYETVGLLGVDVTSIGGFDVTGPHNGRAFAALNLAASPHISTLFAIDLTTGAATAIGALDAEERVVAFAIDSPTIYAIRGGTRLVSFSAQRPGTLLSMVALPASTVFRAMDFDPSRGDLHMVATNSSVWDVQRAGFGSPIGPPLDPALNGETFDIEVSPVDGWIRVVTDAGQNLRCKSGNFASALVDDGFDPSGLHPVAIAHDRNFAGTASSTLYGIDPEADVLVRVDTPNTPTLNVLGSLGVDLIEVGGFDVGPDGVAYFAGVAVPATTPALYAVDLATGQADLIGAIGESASIESIAVRAGSPLELYGGTADHKFAWVDIFQAQQYSLSTFEGLEANESIAAMDFAPGLYLLGLSNQGRLYKIYDWRVDEIRFPNVPVAAFSGTSFGMDFDPNLDALRILTNTGENVRLDPSTAMLVSADQPLAYALGDVNEGVSPNVVALAYTETFSDVPRSTAYAIDATRDQLLRLGGLHGSPSANTGVLTTVGDLGVDVADDAAFDITPDGLALLASGSEILTVNLATGETRRTSGASGPHLTAIAIWLQQNPGF